MKKKESPQKRFERTQKQLILFRHLTMILCFVVVFLFAFLLAYGVSMRWAWWCIPVIAISAYVAVRTKDKFESNAQNMQI